MSALKIRFLVQRAFSPKYSQRHPTRLAQRGRCTRPAKLMRSRTFQGLCRCRCSCYPFAEPVPMQKLESCSATQQMEMMSCSQPACSDSKLHCYHRPSSKTRRGLTGRLTEKKLLSPFPRNWLSREYRRVSGIAMMVYRSRLHRFPHDIANKLDDIYEPGVSQMYSGGPTGIFANALAAWGALQGPVDTHGGIVACIP